MMSGFDEKTIKHIHEGRYAADVEITMHYDSEMDWSSTIGPDDIGKLDRVRQALRRGDIATAAKEAKVFELLPLAGE
jgi:hypothetical protein